MILGNFIMVEYTMDQFKELGNNIFGVKKDSWYTLKENANDCDTGLKSRFT